MTTSNYSIYAIPAFYMLSLGPLLYSSTIIKLDVVNPRGTSFSESRKKSLDKATLARFERARSAHLNALENLPLFASAVICANIAGLEVRTFKGNPPCSLTGNLGDTLCLDAGGACDFFIPPKLSCTLGRML